MTENKIWPIKLLYKVAFYNKKIANITVVVSEVGAFKQTNKLKKKLNDRFKTMLHFMTGYRPQSRNIISAWK